MSLGERLEGIRTALTSGQFPNEASVCTGVVLPILHELGWPVFDPLIVAPEYSVGGRRVDYALCHPKARPYIFVEVKQQGQTQGADRQLFEYAFHVGAPLAVLTDGREWNFYLPSGQGEYHERRFYRLDIVERSFAESEEILKRYIGYSAVSSDGARKAASEDYDSIRRDREIAATIPVAWSKLLKDRDAVLVDLVADQVETICGFKPDSDSVSQFLASVSTSSPPERQRTAPIPSTRSQPSKARTRALQGSAGFTIRGTHTSTKSAIDTLIELIRTLAAQDTTFLDRFASLPKHGRSRRFIGRTPTELYPDRDDLARDYTHQLLPGWWIGTNYGSDQIERIIAMAAEVAGLKFGKDLVVTIPRRDKTTDELMVVERR